jgi:hypothetical protein
MRKPPQEANVDRGHSCALRGCDSGWPYGRMVPASLASAAPSFTRTASCSHAAAAHRIGSGRVFGHVNSCCSRGRDRRKPQRAGLPYWRARPGQHLPSTGTLLLIDDFVDQASATLRLKSVLASEDQKRWPAVFVNAALRGLQRMRAAPTSSSARATRCHVRFVG